MNATESTRPRGADASADAAASLGAPSVPPAPPSGATLAAAAEAAGPAAEPIGLWAWAERTFGKAASELRDACEDVEGTKGFKRALWKTIEHEPNKWSVGAVAVFVARGRHLFMCEQMTKLVRDSGLQDSKISELLVEAIKLNMEAVLDTSSPLELPAGKAITTFKGKHNTNTFPARLTECYLPTYKASTQDGKSLWGHFSRLIDEARAAPAAPMGPKPGSEVRVPFYDGDLPEGVSVFARLDKGRKIFKKTSPSGGIQYFTAKCPLGLTPTTKTYPSCEHGVNLNVYEKKCHVCAKDQFRCKPHELPHGYCFDCKFAIHQEGNAAVVVDTWGPNGEIMSFFSLSIKGNITRFQRDKNGLCTNSERKKPPGEIVAMLKNEAEIKRGQKRTRDQVEAT